MTIVIAALDVMTPVLITATPLACALPAHVPSTRFGPISPVTSLPAIPHEMASGRRSVAGRRCNPAVGVATIHATSQTQGAEGT